ncbi:MAG: PCRF domain-containing protein, partial [bacterium]|nr:PCRF domain-containing protein [bacterium]
MDLTSLREEYQGVLNELSNPDIISDRQKFQDLARSKARLEKIIKKADEVEAVTQRIEENQQILSSREDGDLSALAEQELQGLVKQHTELQKELEDLSHEKEERGALIMEIRPGTGGEEASLFAGTLLRMYTRFAERKHWSCKLLSMNDTELGGVKEAALEIEGEGAFAQLRHEAGVHRVQRIPATEKAGRVHTSTASIAILPKPETGELVIRPDDLEIDFYRSSGAGG